MTRTTAKWKEHKSSDTNAEQVSPAWLGYRGICCHGRSVLLMTRTAAKEHKSSDTNAEQVSPAWLGYLQTW
jgi:hypothetical protein